MDANSETACKEPLLIVSAEIAIQLVLTHSLVLQSFICNCAVRDTKCFPSCAYILFSTLSDPVKTCLKVNNSSWEGNSELKFHVYFVLKRDESSNA